MRLTLLPLLLLPTILGEVIKIGVVVPYALSYVQTAVQLLNLTANEINANATLPFTLQMEFVDSRNTIFDSVQKSVNLITQKSIAGLIGEIYSSITIPMGYATTPFSIPHCSVSTNPALSDKSNYY